MPNWNDRFQRHALWASVEGLRASLDAAELPEDDADRDTHEYVRAVVERVAAFRRAPDPLGITPKMLNAVDGAIRLLATSFTDWRAGTTDYVPVDAAADSVIEALSAWPRSVPQIDEATQESIARMSEATTQAITKLTSERDALALKLESTAEETGKLEALQQELLRDISATQAACEANWDRALEIKRAQAMGVIDELKDLRNQAKSMVHESTSFIVGAEYAAYAKEKSRSALWYDAFAVLFGVMGLVSLFVFLFEKGDTAPSASLALTRLGITTGGFVIGGFLAKRGADHHKEAREARRTSLALSRMAPFIANLDADAREVLTIETADRIFTRGQLGEVRAEETVLRRLQELRAKRAGTDSAEAE